MPRPKSHNSCLPRSPDLPSPKEWLAIAAITLLAATLRLAFPDRMAIEHFDEGVYASNIFFSEAEGGQYPYRHLYAPPLLPWLIEWGIIFLGTESIAPFLPALVLGIATVPLMWWGGRSWFGPLAGLAAALLVATSDFHILYSRAALTDVPVMFFIVLAVYLYFEAIQRESFKWAIWAGVATGLAWWTKYTGWLPLAIAGAGSAAWVLGDLRSEWPRMRERGIKVIWCWGVTAITAFVVWSPVLYGLQEHGGYAAVAENHAGYLISEPAAWFKNTYLQGVKLDLLSGMVTGIGLAIVAGSIPLVKDRPHWWDWTGAAALTVGVLLATASLGPVVTMGLLALAGLLLEAFWRLRRPPDEGQPGQSTLPLWLLTAWLFGMTLTTPLYMPYPRMAFPWLFAAMLLCCRWLASSGATRVPYEGWSRWAVLGAFLLMMVPGILITLMDTIDPVPAVEEGGLFLAEFPQWQDRTGAKQIAEALAERIQAELNRTGRPIVIYSYGEPAIFFYLHAILSDEDVAVIPTGSPSIFRHPVPGATTFVVIDAMRYSRLVGDAAGKELLTMVATNSAASPLVNLDSSETNAVNAMSRDYTPTESKILVQVGHHESE